MRRCAPGSRGSRRRCGGRSRQPARFVRRVPRRARLERPPDRAPGRPTAPATRSDAGRVLGVANHRDQARRAARAATAATRTAPSPARRGRPFAGRRPAPSGPAPRPAGRPTPRCAGASRVPRAAGPAATRRRRPGRARCSIETTRCRQTRRPFHRGPTQRRSGRIAAPAETRPRPPAASGSTRSAAAPCQTKAAEPAAACRDRRRWRRPWRRGVGRRSRAGSTAEPCRRSIGLART